MTANYKVVPFKHWHVQWLEEDGEVQGAGTLLTQDVLKYMEMTNSRTIALDGRTIMCGGTMTQWPGRHVMWAYLSVRSGPHMMFITHETRKYLREIQGRIECTVRSDFEAGHRWARLLGFRVETAKMEGYGPEGESHTGYVRQSKWQS